MVLERDFVGYRWKVLDQSRKKVVLLLFDYSWVPVTAIVEHMQEIISICGLHQPRHLLCISLGKFVRSFLVNKGLDRLESW